MIYFFVRFAGQHEDICSRKGGEVVWWCLGGGLHTLTVGSKEATAAGGCEPGESRERRD